MAATDASLRRDGATLLAAGAFERVAVGTLWAQAQPLLAGAGAFDLGGVTRLDSAGLALLAEIAGALRVRTGGTVPVSGDAPGLSELRAAYRLSPSLDFQA